MVRIHTSKQPVSCDLESNEGEMSLEEKKHATALRTGKQEADALEGNSNKVNTSAMDDTEVHTSGRNDVNCIGSLERKAEMNKLIRSLSLEKYIGTYRNFLYAVENKKIGIKKIRKFDQQIKKLEEYPWPCSPYLAVKLKKKFMAGFNKKYFKFPGQEILTEPEPVLKAVDILKELQGDIQSKNKDQLFFDGEHAIYMQVTSVKMPITAPRYLFIELPHSHIPESSEVCLITEDLSKNGKPMDFEVTAEYYNKRLKSCGVTRISKIITVRQLKREYEVYEMKRALYKRFDFFIIDKKVRKLACHYLGKEINHRKTPIPVPIHIKHLGKQINVALRTTVLKIHPIGNTFSLKVGHTHQENLKIRDNIVVATEMLRKRFPGGWNNILSLSIKAFRTTAIPLHVSVELSRNVPVPIEKPRKYDYVSHVARLDEKYVKVKADGIVETFRPEEKNMRKVVKKALWHGEKLLVDQEEEELEEED